MSTPVIRPLGLAFALRCYAVKVRSRSEEAVANVLRDKSYNVLSPTYTEQRQYSDRIRKVGCALFPGYVFVYLNPANVLAVLKTRGVSYILGSRAGLAPLSDLETQTIETLCRLSEQEHETCKPCDYVHVGQRVRIEKGPLAGLEGMLVRVRNLDRVVVTVESLHSSVSIEVSHTDLRVVESSSNLSIGP